MHPFLILLHWIIVLLCSPFLTGVINKVKAWFSGKKGPGLFQAYFDLAKLARKNSVYSRSTTWIFKASPIIVLTSILIISIFIPLWGLEAPIQFSGDILLIAYLLALARFFMIAAALDTASSFEGMGASREAFFSCLSEIALFMNFITLILLSKNTSLNKMIIIDNQLSWALFGPALILVASSFFLLLLAENCRIPVDDPDTHLELTMIHEVMILDHSGIDLAYLLQASAIKLFVFSAILVQVFFPLKSEKALYNMFIFSGLMISIAVLIGIVESTIARLRLNRVRNLLLIAFALAFFGFITALWRR
jgi:formate hydrogenlyase subunit 4